MGGSCALVCPDPSSCSHAYAILLFCFETIPAYEGGGGGGGFGSGGGVGGSGCDRCKLFDIRTRCHHNAVWGR